jgi:hypothetical protein
MDHKNDTGSIRFFYGRSVKKRITDVNGKMAAKKKEDTKPSIVEGCVKATHA